VNKIQTEAKLCSRRTVFRRITVLFQNCISQYGNKKKPSPEEDTE
jgi:hypothetical protein